MTYSKITYCVKGPCSVILLVVSSSQGLQGIYLRNVKPPKIKMTFLQCLSAGNEVGKVSQTREDGGIHKPRGQLRGMGVNQMITLQNKPYFCKIVLRGEGWGSKLITKNLFTWFMNGPESQKVVAN